jgi:prepilin peptidase dependent protein B
MARRHASAGLGLVEIMVALALGLFIVAAAMGLLLSQLREQHRRLTDTRLRQELRATLVLVEHDLRRAGHWGDPAAGIWRIGMASPPRANPYSAVAPDGSASANNLAYTYTRDASENHAVDAAERFGLRLNGSTGAVELRLGDTWQAVTDPQVARFTALSVTATSDELPLGDRCSLPCPTGSSDCPPRLTLRRLQVSLTAQAAALPALAVRQQRVVHLPTDAQRGHCPA